MQITNATWEKRNLGVDCNEVVVEVGDTLEQLRIAMLEYETDYTVIKVPVGMSDISFYLQSVGYTFIEGFTTCYHPAVLPNLNSLQQRMVDSVSSKRMSSKDWAQMEIEINGGMFRDDRISLDPLFTQNQANNRYLGWMNDEKLRGSFFYIITYKHETIGFFVIRELRDSMYFGVISGIYPKFQKYGLGLCLTYYEIFEGIKLNAKRIEHAYSTNNRGATAIHLLFRFVLKEQYNVFIHHEI
jgi:hypothetical protein